MFRMTQKYAAGAWVFALAALVGCGGTSGQDEDSEKSNEDRMVELVTTTCIDLSGASSQAEAAQVLQFARVGAAALEYSDSDLGYLLQRACGDAITAAQYLP